MGKEQLIRINGKKKIPSIGGKADSLLKLSQKGFHIPVSQVIPWEAYQRYTRKDISVLAELKNEINSKLPEGNFAVRSSANREDGADYSFAGQFTTVLNVPKGQVLDAVCKVWDSTTTESVQKYLQKTSLDASQLMMGVIVQEMVPAEYSGVVFTKNPITGMNELVIEAVKGLGTALVQDGVTPERWVNKWGRWVCKPEDSCQDMVFMDELALQARKIQETFDSDIDLEWVWDGKDIYWVQMRDITSLKNVNYYSNKMAKEMMPGMIKPLVWTINNQLMTVGWIDILTELIGSNDLQPENLTKAFYYRAYFNMGKLGDIFPRLGLPRHVLEIMSGVDSHPGELPKMKMTPQMMGLLPNIIKFSFSKFHFPQKLEKLIHELEGIYGGIDIRKIQDIDDNQLMEKIDELILLNRKSGYHFIIGQVLMQVYNGILNRQLRKIGTNIEEINLTEGMPELEKFDPTFQLQKMHEIFVGLDAAKQNQIMEGGYNALNSLDGVQELREAVGKFLCDYGHLSDSGNNFSVAPWRETPDLIIRLVANYQRPHETTKKELSYKEIRKPFPRVLAINILYKMARIYRYYREYMGFVHNYGYGLFRNYFLAIADRFVKNGVLDERENIFYLTKDEVFNYLKQPESSPSLVALAKTRIKEMEDCKNVILPAVIYGETPPPIEMPNSRKISGTPTSSGYCDGRVKKVWGLADFEKMEQGDILVIPFSDVSWTPLFARAAGVISESGGMLSHSSIIAREYKIPAVVSVAEAPLLQDGMRVTIDGYKGEISILDDSAPMVQ